MPPLSLTVETAVQEMAPTEGRACGPNEVAPPALHDPWRPVTIPVQLAQAWVGASVVLAVQLDRVGRPQRPPPSWAGSGVSGSGAHHGRCQSESSWR